MMKRTSDWKTAREKSSLLGTPSRFQHNFSGSKPNQTTLPFAFPHMVTLRNQAQLKISATTLPTCGPQAQPLAGVANISRPNPPKTNSPQPPAAIPRAVKIVSPKPSSPQVPEKPPPLLPPLPAIGRSYVDIIDNNNEDESEDDTSSSGSGSFDFTEEIYEESQADIETPAAEVTSLINCKFPQHYTPTELFPATLMQAHHLVDIEHFISIAQDDMSLYRNKVDNIVRGMKIHGPLNVNLLSKALEQVIKLHHILTLRVLHTEDYMLQASANDFQLNLAVTSDLCNELPGNIIAQERHKPFSINIKSDMAKLATKILPTADDIHVTSVVDSDHYDNTDKTWPYQTLVRAKLISHSPQDHLLVLTFSRLVCDYWSSCLFLQQLSQSYTRLEQGPSVNRLQTRTLRDDSKTHFASLRQDSQHKLNRSFPGARTAFVHTASKLQPIRQSSLPSSKKLMHYAYGSTNKPSLLQSPQLQFQQVAVREKELLTMISKEKLWSFWQGMITAIIKRALGPSHMKVVPPVRLPGQLGEGKTRPKTSRMRPLTARRNKILTSDKNNPQLGPTSSFHFIKVEEAVCVNFKELFTKQGIKGIQEDEFSHYMCLAGFVLLLGRCCRGWGPKKGLHKTRPQTANLFDVGSFLIGIEVSLRQLMPEPTKGLIGPLTNNVPIRVNLSACETFSDLVVNLSKSINFARKHSHFPFSTVSHDHGMPAILPIKFSYLTQCDVKQLTNPQNFYFVETAVGVEGHGLARLGSNCYVTPINSKLDDCCYLELMMWESVDSNVVGGGFRYHNHVIAPDIVGKLGRELCRLLAHAAEDPGQTLANLVEQINPPFSHHRAAYQMK